MECQLDHLHQPCSIDVKKYFHLPQYLLTTDSLKLPLVQRFSTGGRDPQGATMHSPGGHKQSLSWIPQTCFSTAISWPYGHSSYGRTLWTQFQRRLTEIVYAVVNDPNYPRPPHIPYFLYRLSFLTSSFIEGQGATGECGAQKRAIGQKKVQRHCFSYGSLGFCVTTQIHFNFSFTDVMCQKQ